MSCGNSGDHGPKLIAIKTTLRFYGVLSHKYKIPFGGSKKYQPAYGNKLALLERRRQAGYEPSLDEPIWDELHRRGKGGSDTAWGPGTPKGCRETKEERQKTVAGAKAHADQTASCLLMVPHRHIVFSYCTISTVGQDL
ncbi:hypothetical protein DFH08DRAFT_823946 [Mycena albidolilacea]|uniref:Uncharacterized protein n=1 Tax=Mycena albidolilacea TaxID=1033008 RepID=A0AAD6Z5A5_9AGAR|nr:hypothetical protein DFH08DRAFT_823946 [Mycena albidolilacea]